jgi:hypothetical protein
MEEERYAQTAKTAQVDAVGGKALQAWVTRRMVYLLIRARLIGTYHRHPKEMLDWTWQESMVWSLL